MKIVLSHAKKLLAHRAARTERVAPCRLSFQSGFGRHARLPPLQGWLGRNGLARLQLLRAGSPVLESRRRVDGPHRSQTARTARPWLRRRQYDPPYRGEKRVLFLAILAVARVGIWTTRKKGLYEGANFSHRDLIIFLGISLESKSDAIENAWTA